MMCDDARERLSAFLDGELPAAAARLVADHVADCTSCRKELDDLRTTSGLLGSLSAPLLAVDLAPRVAARARAARWRLWLGSLQQLSAPRRRFIVQQLGRATAIAALFVIAASGVGRGGERQLLALPVRAAAAVESGVSDLGAGVSQAQARLQEEVRSFSPTELLFERLRSTSSPDDERR